MTAPDAKDASIRRAFFGEGALPRPVPPHLPSAARLYGPFSYSSGSGSIRYKACPLRKYLPVWRVLRL